MARRSEIPGDPNNKGWFQRIGVQTGLIFLLLLVLVPVLAVQVVVRYREFRGERRQELQANLEIARAVAETFDALVDDVLHQELAIGLSITSLPPIPSERVHSLLDASQAEYSAVSNISWVTPQGRITASSLESAVGVNIGDRPYFQAIAGGRDWVVSDLVVSRVTKEPVFTISRGIHGAKGTLLGIVVAVMAPDRLGKILGVERGHEGAVAVIDREGKLVYRHPEIKWTWKKRDWLRQYPFLKTVLDGHELKTTIDSDLNGQKRIIGLTTVPLIGWVVGAGRPEAEVMRPLISGFLLNLAVLFVAGLAALLIALGLSRTIAAPLQNLQAHALALGRGEERKDFEVSGFLELRDLARTFNVMAGEIRKREEKLREAHDELERRVQERTFALAKANESLQTEINERKSAEQSLAEKNELLESMFSSIHLLVAYMDPDFNFLRVNRVYAEADGHTPEFFIGKNHFQLYPNEENETIFRKVVETGVPYFVFEKPFEYAGHPERGTSYWDWSLYPVRNPKGEVSGIVLSLVDVTERRHAQDELRKSEQQLRVLSSQLMNAQEKERSYVAQELHDSIASNLAAIKITLENKLFQMGKGPVPPGISLEDIISFVKATINDLRRIMTDLRPAMLDDLGILPTIQWHCKEFQKIYPNIRIETFLCAPGERLAEPLEITIFRILQEAMHNAAKHSNADLIRISLRSEKDLHLTIEDNGSGFDLEEVRARKSSRNGLGLSSMKERAELAGGKLCIESTRGVGTTIRALWPV